MSGAFDLQPTLSNQLITARPLQQDDFETLYTVASDPLVWEQHPNKDRYKRKVFENFFEGAMKSKGAFLILENATGKVIGSSRFYDFDPDKKTISIGYTFLERDYWGKNYNRALKTLMLDHAFQFADKVYFHIGAINIRSQKAIEKLGAVKIDEKEVAYYGESSKLNYIYCIEKRKTGKDT
jgi:RimJ/RimL family protein N-acetyltransferase